jgi:hypothetical protein
VYNVTCLPVTRSSWYSLTILKVSKINELIDGSNVSSGGPLTQNSLALACFFLCAVCDTIRSVLLKRTLSSRSEYSVSARIYRSGQRSLTQAITSVKNHRMYSRELSVFLHCHRHVVLSSISPSSSSARSS